MCSAQTPVVNTGGEHLSEHTDRRTENYYQGRRPIKQNGPREARPAGVGQKKDKFPFGIWHWDGEIRGVRSDHNRDREPVERKIIAKGDIITSTDCVLHKHRRRTQEVNTCPNTRTDGRTENYRGQRPIKQNGPRGARPAGVGQRKRQISFWHLALGQGNPLCLLRS